MVLALFGFLDISFTDILDILLVAVLIYVVFRWMRNSSALNIFLAVISIYVLKVIVDALSMKLMSALLGTFIDVGVVAIIVIFQPEIRHFLMRAGSRMQMGRGWSKSLNSIFGRGNEDSLGDAEVKELTEACRNMSEDKTGALIVLPHKDNLDYIINTGDIVDANVSRRLIMNLFFKNSPLHDGAVIIHNGKIVAARCTLPITDRTDIPASYGMRHKAAIGISEESDADVIVVSEETGRVSFVHGGEVTRINNINELKLKLGSALQKGRKNAADESKTENEHGEPSAKPEADAARDAVEKQQKD